MKAAKFTLVEGGKIALSNNILKHESMAQTNKKIVIKTHDIVNRSVTIQPDPQLAALDAKFARKTAAYNQELKQLKADMLKTARQEAQQLKEAAYQTGYKRGQVEGYAAAQEEGQQQMDVLIKQAQENVLQSVEEVQEYKTGKQSEIKQFAIRMAEVLLKTQLELQPEKIVSVLAPLLFELEKPDEVILLWANSQYHAALDKKLTEIKSEVPDLRYIIFDDDSLDALQLKIESNEKVLVVDLQQELEGFLKQL